MSHFPSTSRQLLVNCISQRGFAKKKPVFVEWSGKMKANTNKKPPSLKVVNTSSRKNHSVVQKYSHILVIDFEATCIKDGVITPVQEIIEFPVVKLCTTEWREVGRFHEYVKPVENPVISSFCTELTGIIQEMVDDCNTLPQVLENFETWVGEDPDLVSGSFALLSCGDWDLLTALNREVAYKNIKLPSYFKNWINLKKAYARHTGHFAKGLPELLRIYELQFKGRHHSGIDDVQNIAEIVKCLGRSGHRFEITSEANENLHIYNP